MPVTQFRAPVTATNRSEVEDVLAGRSKRYEALTLVADEADPILAALRVERPADAKRLVLAKDAAALSRDLARHRKRLGFLRADDVTPAVRALAWGDRSLFGVDRVKAADAWRLNAACRPPTPRRPSTRAPPGRSSQVATSCSTAASTRPSGVRGRGVDFPFDGGTAEITGRRCCSGFGWEIPTTVRTGGKGAVRDLIKSADVAIANFENPAPNRPRYHTSGTVFSADPRIIDGLVNAGIDYVGIANNHIGDAGDTGILQTTANLRKRGLKYSGAGKDLAAASKPAVLKAKGTTVAVLAMTRSRGGTMPAAASRAARHSRCPGSRRTSRRRARPARTSSSCSRTGARSTTYSPFRGHRSWPTTSSTRART